MSRSRLSFLLLLVLAGAPRGVRAQPLDAESEEDVEALVEDGLLADDEEQLLEALRTGVDLGTASAAELASLPGLSRADVERLLRAREDGQGADAAALLLPEQRARLAPFLRPPEAPGHPPALRLRLSTALAGADAWPPPALLQARGEAGQLLSAGLEVAAVRQRVEVVGWDAAHRVLVVAPPAPALHVPRGHLRLTHGAWDVVVGTFRVGFGQRLTLDTTGTAAPDGAVPDERWVRPAAPTSADAATPDFRWRDGFRGLAGGVRGVEVAPGLALSAQAFASLAPRAVAASELFDTTVCAEPRSTREACRGPGLVLSGGGVPSTRSAVAGVLDEAAGGGHLALHLSPGTHLGLTGYAAAPLWRLEGAALDFQESSRFPQGGLYGAVGLDGALALGPLALLGEVSRAFDGVPGRGGDVALLQRTLLSGQGEELELQLRYYGPDYDNPYARPPAAPDEEEGLRARNELGARLSLLRPAWEGWRLRGALDVWRPVRAEGEGAWPHTSAWLRVDGGAEDGLVPSLLLQHTHRQEVGCGAPPCGADVLRTTARVQLRPHPGLSLVLQARHALSLLPGEEARHAARAGLELALRPVSALRLRARVRWDAADVRAPAGGPGLSGGLEVEGRVWPGVRAHARYALAPDASARPVHRFLLDVEARW